MNTEQIHEQRVSELIAVIDHDTATQKRRAVIRLLRREPLAQRIRFEDQCPVCKRRYALVSYTLPMLGEVKQEVRDGVVMERSGVHCGGCGYSNAHWRKVSG